MKKLTAIDHVYRHLSQLVTDEGLKNAWVSYDKLQQDLGINRFAAEKACFDLRRVGIIERRIFTNGHAQFRAKVIGAKHECLRVGRPSKLIRSTMSSHYIRLRETVALLDFIDGLVANHTVTPTWEGAAEISRWMPEVSTRLRQSVIEIGRLRCGNTMNARSEISRRQSCATVDAEIIHALRMVNVATPLDELCSLIFDPDRSDIEQLISAAEDLGFPNVKRGVSNRLQVLRSHGKVFYEKGTGSPGWRIDTPKPQAPNGRARGTTA